MASLRSIFIFTLLIVFLSAPIIAASNPECETESEGTCHNKAKALKLKLIAIGSILFASMLGVCLPIFSRSVSALQPDRDLFMIIKAFASGVILATGYMHVMPDSFDDLRSLCLPENPWRKFPFTTFVAMLSAILTLMVDSFAMTSYKRRCDRKNNEVGSTNTATEKLEHNVVVPNKNDNAGDNGASVVGHGHGHGHGHGLTVVDEKAAASQLLRYRVVAQVLELGIVVHSVVIGLSLGASNNQCTIRPLVAALCFHQLFEGMGLGGCILQADYGTRMKAVMVFFFSATTPFGIALGIGLSNVYKENSPTALIVVGLLNASSAGLLNYMALVDLLAADFMGPKLQGSMKLQMWAYIAVLLGAGGMSLMAKWA